MKFKSMRREWNIFFENLSKVVKKLWKKASSSMPDTRFQSDIFTLYILFTCKHISTTFIATWLDSQMAKYTYTYLYGPSPRYICFRWHLKKETFAIFWNSVMRVRVLIIKSNNHYIIFILKGLFYQMDKWVIWQKVLAK